MCGIAGYVDPTSKRRVRDLQDIGRAMLSTVAHRGPDDSGVWVDSEAGVCLSHARLSIIDPSAAGRQPMVSAEGRYVINYNGEIYNFRELRRELNRRGRHFRGDSDTEVVLNAVAEWGLEEALSCLVGMFAFAIWDREAGRLHLVRDPIGIKPLYYGWSNGVFGFGSELNAIRAHPDFSPELDIRALALYLRYLYVPAPHSIFEGIRKLEPGTGITVGPSTVAGDERLWNFGGMHEAITQESSKSFAGDIEVATDQVHGLLKEAVRKRMVADVPLGAFLSGGIDSATVVAIMQEASEQPVRTFTIGFSEEAHNEAPYARNVANHLGTEHTELMVSSERTQDVIPNLPRMYDEPFADSSAIPTFLVSELARQDVTVVLSGDGGDEVFGGYDRYELGPALWKKLQLFPRPLRRIVASCLRKVEIGTWDKVFDVVRRVVPEGGLGDLRGQQVHTLARFLSMSRRCEVYDDIVSLWNNPFPIIDFTADTGDGRNARTEACQGIGDFAVEMMCCDLLTYLPDDILTKVDRASMSVGLEVRVPILDQGVVEFAARLPRDYKLNGEERKRPLRRVAHRYMPRELFDRPKHGFTVPIARWLRGPLRPWAEDFLSRSALKNTGYLDPEPIESLWERHLKGDQDWSAHLWAVLMFQAWAKTHGVRR